MIVTQLILVLLGAAAALNVAARRLAIPHPVLLVLGGLALALLPGLPKPHLDPDAVFLIFIPPLVYRAALTTSWRDFRERLRSILLLAVGLVLATIFAIAAVAHAIVPGLTWPASLLLGAILAPSDPVAAIAVMRRLDVPRTVDTVLAGEGLVNDATALVAYRMAVNAVSEGAPPPLWSAALRLVLVGAGGIAIGLAVGAAIVWLRRRLAHAPEVENTISLLTPFAAFIPADRLGVSGVLAVVAVGLYLGRESPRIVSPETRIQGGNMWDIATFILEGLIFIVVGLDLPLATQDLPQTMMPTLVRSAIVISIVAIAVRLAWVFPGTYVPRRIERWFGRTPDRPPWQHVLFVGWAGMRGADSLVIALALPLTIAGAQPFPARNAIIFVTFAVILGTLVVQGLTLAPLLHLLGMNTPGTDEEEEEEALARKKITQAGVAKLDQIIKRNPRLAPAARHLRSHHVTRHGEEDEAASKVRADMIAAERKELVRLRDKGVIGDDVMRVVQHDLDLEQMLVGNSEETLESLRVD